MAYPGKTTLSASVMIFMVTTKNSGLEEQMAVVAVNLGKGHKDIFIGQQLVFTCCRPSCQWKNVRKGHERPHGGCGIMYVCSGGGEQGRHLPRGFHKLAGAPAWPLLMD